MFKTFRTYNLPALKWQKMKKRFLTCPCHKIYKEEAVSLKSFKCQVYFRKYDFCKNVKIRVQFREKLIFCQQLLNQSSNLRILLHICEILYIVILCRTSHFVSTYSIFSYIQIFLSNFACFTVKPHSITQKSVSRENTFKKSKNPSPFSFPQGYRLK